jgi:predicted PurR-regulated permease PerM
MARKNTRAHTQASGKEIVSDRKPDPQTVCLVITAIVAAGIALYFGREFFQPLAIALILRAVLRPLVRTGEKIRLPAPMGAAILLLALISIVVATGTLMVGPVERWLARAPHTLSVAEHKLNQLRRPMQRASDVANRIERAATPPSTMQAAPGPPAQAPGVLVRLFGTTTRLVTGIVEVLLILFLLLAAGDVFLQRLVRFLHITDASADARDVVHELEHAVRRYLVVAACVFAGQGVVVALVMWMLGMPYPILWGAFTVVLEFMPYVGAAVMICLLSITAVASFDNVGHILLVPISYLVISTIQANIVSPYAMGQRLELNPVAILLGVLFWWLLWGIPGAFVAVPILAAMKIVADRTSGLKRVGDFLSA